MKRFGGIIEDIIILIRYVKVTKEIGSILVYQLLLLEPSYR
jgi:hypothetical protein